MPSHPCRWPTCPEYVRERGTYCPAHAEAGRKDKGRAQAHYDQHMRDPIAKIFYNSAAWLRARMTKLSANPICERCREVFAAHVHHVKPLKECTPAQKTAQGNLMSLCASCHNIMEAKKCS